MILHIFLQRKMVQEGMGQIFLRKIGRGSGSCRQEERMKHKKRRGRLFGWTELLPERTPDEDAHKVFESQIPLFFADELTNRELERFLDHYEVCSACQDELSVQYLIHAGLEKLETGEAFNLQKELGAFVETQRTRLWRRERNGKLTAAYEILTLTVFAAAVAACYVLGIV